MEIWFSHNMMPNIISIIIDNSLSHSWNFNFHTLILLIKKTDLPVLNILLNANNSFTDEAPQNYNSSQRLKSLREKEQKGLKKYETKLSFVKVEG